MHFPDLTPYTNYLLTPVERVQNVGWLDANAPFVTGSAGAVLLEKLERIILSSGTTDFHVNRLRSARECDLSAPCGKVSTAGGVLLGWSELWIPRPDSATFFASPSLVYHYIAVHGYEPPREFSQAIEAIDLTIPFNGQQKYLELVAGHF